MKSDLYNDVIYSNTIGKRYEKAANKYGKRIVGRQWYFDHIAEILSLSEQCHTTYLEIYPFDWKFNKNERGLWQSIRLHNVVFYPEFPIFDKHFDFANPYFKIALEADSKMYHESNKDSLRDDDHFEFGWMTFRVSYSETQASALTIVEIFEKHDDYEHVIDEIEDVMLHSSCGVVKAIEYFYFRDKSSQELINQRIPEFRDLARTTLLNHTRLSPKNFDDHLTRATELKDKRNI